MKSCICACILVILLVGCCNPRWCFMVRKVLWVSLLSISLAAFAQVSAPPTSNNTYVPTIAALPGGYGAANGGVLLSTPGASFAPPPNTAGISNDGRAGISNSAPLTSGSQPGVPAGSYVYTPWAIYNAPSAPEQPPSYSDVLPSFYSNNVGTPVNGRGPSLAEYAARFQRGHAPTRARTYTNADVPRENAGLLTPVLVAEGRLPADAQNSPTLMASASAPPLPTRSARPAPGASTESASATQPSQPANSRGELPASATILPLLGMLGLASGGLGMILRRKR